MPYLGLAKSKIVRGSYQQDGLGGPGVCEKCLPGQDGELFCLGCLIV